MNLFDVQIDRTKSGCEKWDKYKNQDVIPMWVADMDFKSPQAIIDALTHRVEHGVFGYTGIDKDTNKAVIDFIQRHYNWRVKPEWIVWLPGVVSGMNITCKAIDTQDVIINTPIYPHFVKAPNNANLNLIKVPLVEKNSRWTIDFDAFEKAINPTCKLFLFCNPYNPGGTVFTKEELEKISKICVKHDLIICSDEIHADLILNPQVKHIPIASLNEEIAKRSITLLAPSKTFNIAGLQSSYAIIPDVTLRKSFKRAMAGFPGETNLLAITATKAAYTSCDEWLEALRVYLKENLNLVQEFVKKHPKLKLLNQDATFLSWIDVSALNLENPYEYFLKYGVGLSEGEPFGDKNFLRLNFGTTKVLLKEGLLRIEKALKNLE
ncbi:MalY/PatB family protein [Sulfurospirillum arcachonense]|uniref:MalY/PatB family protein n=1 Tax=Sulfurospirillum arcachonense TaxID=57666 RepID=UPI00046955B3|nr:PatB family C-S lyase [Sulfurospirillum arcachonense]